MVKVYDVSQAFAPWTVRRAGIELYHYGIDFAFVVGSEEELVMVELCVSFCSRLSCMRAGKGLLITRSAC